MKTIIKIIFLLHCVTLFSQDDVALFFNSIKKSDFKNALVHVDAITDKKVKKALLNHLKIRTSDNSFDFYVNSTQSSKPYSIAYNIELLNLGLITYLRDGNEPKAIDILKDALNISKENNNNILACEALKLTLEINQRFGSILNDSSYEYILEDYKNMAYDNFEKQNYHIKELILRRKSHKTKTSSVFEETHKKKLNKIYKEKADTLMGVNHIFLNAKKNMIFSDYEKYLNNDLERSNDYIILAIHQLEQLDGVFEEERLIAAKINKTINLYNSKNYDKAYRELNKIKISDKNYMLKLLNVYYNYWKYRIEESLGDSFKSCQSRVKYLELELLLDQSRKAYQSQESEKKHQITEKEKQILIEQEQKKKNRNIAFGLGGLLLFGGITFILIQKNTKRKQLIAEQEKEIQTQKLATVLKEQELTSIDAMIEGQEKERQRIANDLHDDLGGLMATVKLHFNALKEKQSPELYKKTDKLLDEAYHKIRSVAHTKNSGVMAKKGLLKAINDMAKTISASNKLQIDVIDHGLEHRLENSLELTIFRIIQELITNIIKHAEATEATIHITNHDDSLNIMVEDNGKGFNPKTITKNAGMGIHSIDKRIENLGGTVTIESEHKKGTTVIIDIPS